MSCKVCIAKDYFIASLKETIREKDNHIDLLVRQIHLLEEREYEIIRHTTGMNRAIAPRESTGEVHSVSRNTGIRSRIHSAERSRTAEAAPLTEQRKKEFEERIASLNNPEIEVRDEA